MPRRERQAPRPDVRRAALVATAAALGLAALCLVVFGTSQRESQGGVLLGLWGALIATFAVFGPRRELAAARQDYIAQEIGLRQFGELQLVRDTAGRREAELNLERSLRHEIERVMSEQLGALREEVAALRAEVLDNLGGQLRLERIETRVTGPDLEALQHQLHRLGGSQHSLAATTAAAAVRVHATAQTHEAALPAPEAAPAVTAGIVDVEPVEPAQALTHAVGFAPQVSLQQLVERFGGAERRPGRRRAPESEPKPEALRYQGRRRADPNDADPNDADQDRADQDRTDQDRTGQDGTGQDGTGQDRTGQDRTDQDRADQNQAPSLR